MIKLESFKKDFYADLISWVDSEETLLQFAGPAFTFPLTGDQLDHSLSDGNRFAFRVVEEETNISIGHYELYLNSNSFVLGRILIGDKEKRRKGYGNQIVYMLLGMGFNHFNKDQAELNVFDWNTAAIECYKKAGFTINPGKILERKVKNETWVALNMTLDKNK
jgi:RimJ/RimL family protein N-acetyltransferase